MTKIRRPDKKNLKVIGSALQPKYFNVQEMGSENYCLSSVPIGKSFFRIFNKLVESDVIGLDEGKRMSNIESAASRELNFMQSSHVKADPETFLSQINLLPLTEPDDSDCLDATSNSDTESNVDKIKLDAITKAIYGDSLNTSSNIYMAQVKQKGLPVPDYGDCWNANSNVMTSSYVAQIELDASTKSVCHMCLDDNLNVETNTYMSQMELDANAPKVDYIECLNDNLDVQTSSYTVQTELDILTGLANGDCLNVNSDMETSSCMAQKGSDALIKTDDCLSRKSDFGKNSYDDSDVNFDMETIRYMAEIELDVMAKADFSGCLDSKQHKGQTTTRPKYN